MRNICSSDGCTLIFKNTQSPFTITPSEYDKIPSITIVFNTKKYEISPDMFLIWGGGSSYVSLLQTYAGTIS
jgi:hypothetical protein